MVWLRYFARVSAIHCLAYTCRTGDICRQFCTYKQKAYLLALRRSGIKLDLRHTLVRLDNGVSLIQV
jgi:hypothetical protein